MTRLSSGSGEALRRRREVLGEAVVFHRLPEFIDVLSMITSVAEVPTVPCSWQVVPRCRRPGRTRRHRRERVHGLDAAEQSFDPAEAAAGASVISPSSVLPESAVPVLVGAVPE
jgi:hypothetical protein